MAAALAARATSFEEAFGSLVGRWSALGAMGSSNGATPRRRAPEPAAADARSRSADRSPSPYRYRGRSASPDGSPPPSKKGRSRSRSGTPPRGRNRRLSNDDASRGSDKSD